MWCGVVDRKLKAFMARQVERLLDAARECDDPELQGHILAMAESWMRSSLEHEERPETRRVH